MYNYRIGTHEPFRGVVGRFIYKATLFTAGGIAGTVAGLFLVVAQVQGSVQPLTITYGNGDDSRNVLPIVHALQQNGSLRMGSTVSDPDDMQPAGGYNNLQRTDSPQPTIAKPNYTGL